MARLFNNIELWGKANLRDRLINVFKPLPLKAGNAWYQEIEPTVFYSEEDLERSILLNIEALFPEFYAVTYKRKLKNSRTMKENAPDLAMVKKDYTEWYIIEVELANHDVTHIEKQIDTFFNANYGLSDVKYFIQKNKGLFDENKLSNLIHSEPPKLMVIANSLKDEIKSAIDPYNCSLCVFQMFLDKDHNPFYRLDGEYPLVFSSFCFCKLEKNLPYTIQLLDDNQFRDAYKLHDKTIFDISFNNILTKWQVSSNGNVTYLICNSKRFPLDPSTKRYKLSYNDNTKLFSFSKA